MIPWFLFSDAIGSVTNTFLDYSYMVKKLKFRLSLLPLVKIGSSFIVHFFFLIISTIVFNFYGYPANWSYLQILYYLLALLYLILGIGLLTSSLSVYLRDTSQVVGIFIQIGFWAIPIVWGPESLHGVAKIILKLNPIYYIVQGYREIFLTGEVFWSHPIYATYYWGVSTVIFLLGIYTFRKLRLNFADVL
jgi:teichoic acid transport system permease protein